ncbi:MAG: CBS domain-containing protein [Kofleriaceae bacterium]
MSAPVRVHHLMSTKVVSFFPEQSLTLAEEVMRLHKFRHLPVIDAGGQLIGIVTDRDILSAKVSSLRGIAASTRMELDSAILIRDIMTEDVWSARPSTTAAAAGRLLLDHRFSCLPVTDEDGILVGILTLRDYLRFAVSLVEGPEPPEDELELVTEDDPDDFTSDQGELQRRQQTRR